MLKTVTLMALIVPLSMAYAANDPFAAANSCQGEASVWQSVVMDPGNDPDGSVSVDVTHSTLTIQLPSSQYPNGAANLLTVHSNGVEAAYGQKDCQWNAQGGKICFIPSSDDSAHGQQFVSHDFYLSFSQAKIDGYQMALTTQQGTLYLKPYETLASINIGTGQVMDTVYPKLLVASVSSSSALANNDQGGMMQKYWQFVGCAPYIQPYQISPGT